MSKNKIKLHPCAIVSLLSLLRTLCHYRSLCLLYNVVKHRECAAIVYFDTSSMWWWGVSFLMIFAVV